jgi:hypothetical protein
MPWTGHVALKESSGRENFEKWPLLERRTDFKETNFSDVDWISRVSQEERSIFWEVIVLVILRKKVYMNMCPILNGFRHLACSILNLGHNIFLPSHQNVPLSAACESEWSVSWLLWLLLIGPIILDDCMSRQNCLEFLLNELPQQLEDVALATRIAMCFQHDGAPHYTRLVMQHLNDTFPNQWNSCGGTNNWPPRSPGLTPLDFCSWSWMKSEVYRREVDTWDELLDRIMDAIAPIKEC